MAAHVGINNQSTSASTLYGINTPSGGYTNEATKEDAVELATVRDESGVTKVCKPKNLKTTTSTIRGKGVAALSGVSAGSFSSGTVKVVAAKQTENSDDFPDFEITGRKYSNA